MPIEHKPSWMDEDWFNDDAYTVFSLPDQQDDDREQELMQLELFNFD